MERWKLYAFAAALFAGLTSVVAKAGLKNMSADVGLAIRTGFVFVFIMLNTFLWSENRNSVTTLSHSGWRPVALLGFSGLTTTLSWVCYYRAMKEGTVSYVSLIDKGSILVTLLLSVLVLGEAFTWRTGVGAALIIAGLLVLAGGK